MIFQNFHNKTKKILFFKLNKNKIKINSCFNWLNEIKNEYY